MNRLERNSYHAAASATRFAWDDEVDSKSLELFDQISCRVPAQLRQFWQRTYGAEVGVAETIDSVTKTMSQ